MNKNEPSYKLWWKLVGSIIIFLLLVKALTDGVLYIPARNGFLSVEESPEAFGITLAMLFPLCVYSFYQGATGLYKNFKQKVS
ncbi:hypothetical protein J7384_10845 [Endozoicomonas sp. G2_1]|uniref:hypothetical protein n=1 Tax=Endozoicomonas sp. G2_1 TaxID=2821091 RepID=UPI001ADA2DF4|nr:hypothetical protein [Endozoicomonas sp. G2_1]MBO9490854.1 hypothetical protein [Endozoicomonas sp. G2_1]